MMLCTLVRLVLSSSCRVHTWNRTRKCEVDTDREHFLFRKIRGQGRAGLRMLDMFNPCLMWNVSGLLLWLLAEAQKQNRNPRVQKHLERVWRPYPCSCKHMRDKCCVLNASLAIIGPLWWIRKLEWQVAVDWMLGCFKNIYIYMQTRIGTSNWEFPGVRLDIQNKTNKTKLSRSYTCEHVWTYKPSLASSDLQFAYGVVLNNCLVRGGFIGLEPLITSVVMQGKHMCLRSSRCVGWPVNRSSWAHTGLWDCKRPPSSLKFLPLSNCPWQGNHPKDCYRRLRGGKKHLGPSCHGFRQRVDSLRCYHSFCRSAFLADNEMAFRCFHENSLQVPENLLRWWDGHSDEQRGDLADFWRSTRFIHIRFVII